MKIGPMRHRITIRNFITTRTPSGQPTEEWSDGATIWAEVKGNQWARGLTAGAERADATPFVYGFDIAKIFRHHRGFLS